MKRDSNPDVRELEARFTPEERARAAERSRPTPRPLPTGPATFESEPRSEVLWTLFAFSLLAVAGLVFALLRR